MEPNRFGKTLGIGMRVASRMVRERTRSGSAIPTRDVPNRERNQPKASRNVAEPARRMGEGTRRFGKALVGPLAHTGATLWLEITGLFFALFALFFVQNAWRVRTAMHSGPEHGHFILYVLLAGCFLYFSATSFLRSRQRSRKARARS